MCFEDVSSYENRTKSGAIKAMLRESWGCGHLPNSVCNSYAWLSLFGHALRNMISAAFSFNTAFLQCFYSSVWHLLWPLWTFGTPELGPRLRSVAVVASSKYWCVGARLQQQRRKLVQPLVPSDLTPKSSASFCVTPSHHRHRGAKILVLSKRGTRLCAVPLWGSGLGLEHLRTRVASRYVADGLHLKECKEMNRLRTGNWILISKRCWIKLKQADECVGLLV